MYRYFIFILFTLFFSCTQQEEKKPKHLLSESQMIDALTEVHLLESAAKLNLLEGLKNEKDRASVILYMNSQSDSPLPKP